MADMKFSCPHCQQHISADAGYAGLQINCPSCNGSLIVPADPAAAAPAPAVESASAPAPAPARLSIRAPAPATAPPPLSRPAQPAVGAGRPGAVRKPVAPAGSGDAPWYKTPWPYVGLLVVLLGVFYLMGMMLAFVGVALLYILTVHIITIVAAFKESVTTGLLTLCIPIYALYFVFKVNENDTLKILYGVGILINILTSFLPHAS